MSTHALQATPSRLRPGRLFTVGVLMTVGGLAVSIPLMLVGSSDDGPRTAPAPAAPADENPQAPAAEAAPEAEWAPGVISVPTRGWAALGAVTASQPVKAPTAPAQAPAPAPAPKPAASVAPAAVSPAAVPALPPVGSLLPGLPGPSAADAPLSGGLLPTVTDTVDSLPLIGDVLGGVADSPVGGLPPLPVVGDVLPTVTGTLGGGLLGGDLLGGDLLGGLPLDAEPVTGLLGGLLG